MRVLTFVFVLALFYTPLFGAPTVEVFSADVIAGTKLTDWDGDTGATGYSALLGPVFGDFGGDMIGGVDSSSPPVANSASEATDNLSDTGYSTATGTTFTDALITEIAGYAGYASTTVLLTTLDSVIDKIIGCVNTATNTCLCGGTAADTSMNANWHASTTPCGTSPNLEMLPADILTFNRWLDHTKITPATAQFPGFSAAELTAISAGTWADLLCYEASPTAPATSYTNCAYEYTLLRGLWDSKAITSAIMTGAGLTPTNIPAMLYAYELSAHQTDWDKVAQAVSGDDTAVWDDDFKDDLTALFCSDGAISTASDVETAAAKADIEFTFELFAEFVDEIGVALDADYSASDDSKWLWVDAICPGNGDAGFEANVKAWSTLFAELSGVEEGDFKFDFAVSCNIELAADLAEDHADYTDGGATDVACPVCLADGVEATFGNDLKNKIVRLEKGADGAGAHLCRAAPPPPPPSPDKLDPTVMPTCDADVTDETDAKFCTAEMLAIIAELEAADSGRGFVISISLLAALALLQK